MARGPKKPEVGMPTVSAQRGVELLKQLRNEAEAMLAAGAADSDAVSAWKVKAENILGKAFGQGHSNVRSVLFVRSSSRINAPKAYYDQERLEDMQKRVGIIRSLEEILLLDADDDVPISAPVDEELADPTSVFLVHGHDEKALRNVESFIRQRALNPVILKDAPNLGRTLVEKLEANSRVAYAIVIMTGDDVGGVKGGGSAPRARQNVVLELGYFAALLNRRNIAVLFESGVEMPSDFDGVAYIELDEGGGWHFKLLRELTAAGLKVKV